MRILETMSLYETSCIERGDGVERECRLTPILLRVHEGSKPTNSMYLKLVISTSLQSFTLLKI